MMGVHASVVLFYILGAGLPAQAAQAASVAFVTPLPVSGRNVGIRSGRLPMAEEEEIEAYSELPADWRNPSLDAPSIDEEADSEEDKAERKKLEEEMRKRVRTPEEILKTVEQVRPSVGGRRLKNLESPPDPGGLQTGSQRRRNLPLSQLKRVKPKKRITEDGEFRPLVPKTDRESVLRGEDYWIDYKELDAQRERQEAQRKRNMRPPPEDQFAQEKLRAEIVQPYKQNWILIVSIFIAALAGFIQINPGVLDSFPVGFPAEL